MSRAPDLAPLTMTVLAGDGLLLAGRLDYPAGAPPAGGWPLAVLAHQYPGTRDTWAPLRADLLGMGVAVLAFDQRGHGESVRGPAGSKLVIDTPRDFEEMAFYEAFVSSIKRVRFASIADDILRVAAWGAAQNFVDGSRLLLGGGSVGGTGALLAAPSVKGLRGVLTLGAAGAAAHGDDAHERIRVALSGGAWPALLASSADDAFEGADNVRRWSVGLAHVTTRIVPGAAHAMGIYYDVREDVLGAVRSWVS